MGRNLFRWYLSQFPLRDGKAFFYERLHAGLTPRDRYAVVRLDKGFRMKLDLSRSRTAEGLFLRALPRAL